VVPNAKLRGNASATANAGPSSAGKWRAAFAKWRNADGASATAEPASGVNMNTGAGADTDANTASTTPIMVANPQAAGADTPPTNNDPNDPSQQAETAKQTADRALAQAVTVGAAAAFNAANDTSGAPPQPSKDGADDNNDATDSGNATPGANPAANPQPVAAAVMLDTDFNAAPAIANGQSISTINEQAKPRVKVTPALAGSQNSSAQDAKDAAAARTATATQAAADEQSNGAGGSTATNGKTTDPSQPNAGAQQSQALTQTNNAAALLTQSTAAAGGFADRIIGRGDGSTSTTPASAVGATNAPSASGAADALPNFGFLATNAMSTGAAAATPSAPDAAVPLAGLAVAIAARAQAGTNQFAIRLDPPELGRIDVRLDVDRNGQVTSHVTVDRADTLQLLQTHQPQLEQALQQAGLKTTDNGLQFTLRDQSFAGQNGQNGHGGGQQNTAQLVIPDAQAAPIDTAQIYARLNLGSGLDIRV